VDPVLSGDEIKMAAETYRDLLKDEGCTIVSFDDLGLKQLAYTIKKRNSGVYYTIEFNTPEGLVIPKLELSLRRDERIVRFLSVKLDKYGIKYNEDKRNGLIGKKEPKKKDEKDNKKNSGASAKKAAPAKDAAKSAPAKDAPVKEAAKDSPAKEVAKDAPVKAEETTKLTETVTEKAPVVETVKETKAEEVKVTEKVVEKTEEAAPKVTPVETKGEEEKVVTDKLVTEKVVEAPAEATKVEAAAPVVAAAPVEVIKEKVEKPAFDVTDGGDNFTKIEGVGPKTHQVLRDAGLKRYRDLAALSKDEIKAILEKGGSQFNGFDTTTWSQQAQLAEDGKWDELKLLQDKLDGGKLV